YIEQVQAVTEDIRRGRYYQLNLLRYFLVDLPEPRNLLLRMLRLQSPFSSWYEGDGRGVQLISFSPERFICVNRDAEGFCIQTFPIKGTRPRLADPKADNRIRGELAASSKDHAELAMIVD